MSVLGSRSFGGLLTFQGWRDGRVGYSSLTAPSYSRKGNELDSPTSHLKHARSMQYVRQRLRSLRLKLDRPPPPSARGMCRYIYTHMRIFVGWEFPDSCVSRPLTISRARNNRRMFFEHNAYATRRGHAFFVCLSSRPSRARNIEFIQ